MPRRRLRVTDMHSHTVCVEWQRKHNSYAPLVETISGINIEAVDSVIINMALRLGYCQIVVNVMVYWTPVETNLVPIESV